MSRDEAIVFIKRLQNIEDELTDAIITLCKMFKIPVDDIK